MIARKHVDEGQDPERVPEAPLQTLRSVVLDLHMRDKRHQNFVTVDISIEIGRVLLGLWCRDVRIRSGVQ